MTPTEIKKKTTELKKQYYKENLVGNSSNGKRTDIKTSSNMVYLQNKLHTLNSKQLIDFIFNYSLLEDETISEEAQNKAYDNLMELFYGKEGNRWVKKRKNERMERVRRTIEIKYFY